MSSISVIICVNNQKYELRKSLDSVKKQSIHPEEIIIVDYSADDLCRKYIESDIDAKIRYISVPVEWDDSFDEFMAFETGLKYASCEYAAFFVAGDVWTEDKISKTKEYLVNNSDKDVIVSSFKKYVGFSEKNVLLNNLQENYSGINSLFMYWYAPSAVVMKRQIALALNAFSVSDFDNLKLGCISAFVSTLYYGVEKDSLYMEKIFWDKFYSRINSLNVVQEAALFCIHEFQNDKKSKESLELFASTVSLKTEDVVKVVFGIKEFTQNKLDVAAYTEQLNKKQQNYLLMRNWLEMKISGHSVAQNLKEKAVVSVAIYGAGKHGTVLFNDLKSSDIKIIAWIDKNPSTPEILGCPVYTPADFSSKNIIADSIIVTPYLEFEKIAKDLADFGLKNVVSLKDVIR